MAGIADVRQERDTGIGRGLLSSTEVGHCQCDYVIFLPQSLVILNGEKEKLDSLRAEDWKQMWLTLKGMSSISGRTGKEKQRGCPETGYIDWGHDKVKWQIYGDLGTEEGVAGCGHDGVLGSGFQRWSNTGNYGNSQESNHAYVLKWLSSKSALWLTLKFPGKKETKDKDKIV